MARDLDAVRTALRAYLAGGERIEAVLPLSYGLSNGTYRLEGADRILRMPPAEDGLLPPYDMARQHAVYRAVAATPGAPPVPRVFELCEDESVAGAPFFVMERLPGESFDRHNLPPWLSNDPAACGALCQAWVDAMAQVHRMPVATLGGPIRTSAGEAASWLAMAAGVQADALILDILDEFRAHPPPDTGPPTPVHGDPNLTNLLWDRTRVVALLDWELCGVGEPMSDVGFLLTSFRDEGEPSDWGFDAPGWWTKPRVAEHWAKQTGRSGRDWRRHELLAMARLATILSMGRALYRDGRKSDPRIGEWEDKVPRYLERLARRRSRVWLDD